jgi:hypothetical protein
MQHAFSHRRILFGLFGLFGLCAVASAVQALDNAP